MTRYEGSYGVGVIGHTGTGNYGHGLDLAFVGLPRAEVVAVADADCARSHPPSRWTGARSMTGAVAR